MRHNTAWTLGLHDLFEGLRRTIGLKYEMECLEGVDCTVIALNGRCGMNDWIEDGHSVTPSAKANTTNVPKGRALCCLTTLAFRFLD